MTVSSSSLDFSLGQANRFSFYFSNLPNITYTLTEVGLPGISMSNPEVATPFKSVYYGADKAQFEDLSISFIVQEDMDNYFELHDWLRAISFPNSFADRVDINKYGEVGYGVLTINNSNNLPVYRLVFEDIIPASLSSLQLSASSSEEHIATASFQYTIFKRERVYKE